MTVHPDGTSSYYTSIVVIDADSGAQRTIHSGAIGTWGPSGDIVLDTKKVISDTGEEKPYTFKGVSREFSPDGAHLVTEWGNTIFIYDRDWCGRALINVENPYPHWLGWAGPTRILVRVNYPYP